MNFDDALPKRALLEVFLFMFEFFLTDLYFDLLFHFLIYPKKKID
jgi:hypothetical protein